MADRSSEVGIVNPNSTSEGTLESFSLGKRSSGIGKDGRTCVSRSIFFRKVVKTSGISLIPKGKSVAR